MSFLLILTLVRVSMEDHSQQSRWKVFKHFIIITTIASIIVSEIYVTYRPRDRFIKDFLDIYWSHINVCYRYKERFLTQTVGYWILCSNSSHTNTQIFHLSSHMEMLSFNKISTSTAVQIINIIIELVFDITARRVF